MYRNPKDQAVSWFHFINKISPFNKEAHDAILGKDWNEFFAKYTAGNLSITLYLKLCLR